MATRIGLISDVHATPGPLQEALTIFLREGVDSVLCAGDLAGYGSELEQTVALLKESGCQAISGNHDLWWLSRTGYLAEGLVKKYLRSLPQVLELSFEAKKVYMVHASPPFSLMEGIKLLDENGNLVQTQKNVWADSLKSLAADILIVGHTHQVFAEQLGGVLVINPGSTRFNHTCAILTLPEMDVQILPLSGQKPVLAWNWGMLYAEQRSQPTD